MSLPWDDPLEWDRIVEIDAADDVYDWIVEHAPARPLHYAPLPRLTVDKHLPAGTFITLTSRTPSGARRWKRP